MKIQKINKTLLEMYPAYKKVMGEEFEEPERLGYGQCAPILNNRIPEAKNLIKRLSAFSEEDAENSAKAKYYIEQLELLDQWALKKLDEVYDFKNYAERRVDALESHLNNLRKIIHSSPFMIGESLREDTGTNNPQKPKFEVTYTVNGKEHKETKSGDTQEEVKQKIRDNYTTADNIQFTQVRQIPINSNLQESKTTKSELSDSNYDESLNESILREWEEWDDRIDDEEDFSYTDDDYTGDTWGEFSDDEVEDDLMHSKVYGGDPSYCEICGTKLQYEDGYPYCPECKKEIEFEEEENI